MIFGHRRSRCAPDLPLPFTLKSLCRFWPALPCNATGARAVTSSLLNPLRCGGHHHPLRMHRIRLFRLVGRSVLRLDNVTIVLGSSPVVFRLRSGTVASSLLSRSDSVVRRLVVRSFCLFGVWIVPKGTNFRWTRVFFSHLFKYWTLCADRAVASWDLQGSSRVDDFFL